MKKMLLFSVAASVSLMAGAVTQEFAPMQEKDNRVSSVRLLNNKMEKSQVVVMPAKNVNKKAAIAVRPLADEQLSASYLFPGYYMAFGTDSKYAYDLVGYPQMVSMIAPAYVPVTYRNTSTGATQYSWSYQDPQNDFVQATSTETDLTATYTPAWADFPSLTASNGSATDEFAAGSYVATFGGNPSMPGGGDDGSEIINCYVTATDLNTASLVLYGLGQWEGESLGRFGVCYPAPASTYAISSIFVYAACDFEAGTELYADIYAIESEDESGMTLSEKPIGTAYFYAEQDYLNQAAEEGQYSTYRMSFSVVKDDGIYLVPTVLNVDTPIAIIFRGYENVNIFSPLELEDAGLTSTSYWVTDAVGEFARGVYLDINENDTLDEGDIYPTGLAVYTDATFGWFFPESDRVEETEWGGVVNASTTGETITIPFNSYFYSSETTAQAYNGEDGGEVDWIEFSLADNDQTITTDLTVKVDALPDGVEGRKCYIVFTPTGSAPYKLHIGQGTVGVESAVITSAAQVSVVGENFVVNAPETINAVTVYNVAGQAVATSEIAGNTTVDASSLAKGVYVLRFNDGSTVKVIK